MEDGGYDGGGVGGWYGGKPVRRQGGLTEDWTAGYDEGGGAGCSAPLVGLVTRGRAPRYFHTSRSLASRPQFHR
jgi:hypothetical protein